MFYGPPVHHKDAAPPPLSHPLTICPTPSIQIPARRARPPPEKSNFRSVSLEKERGVQGGLPRRAATLDDIYDDQPIARLSTRLTATRVVSPGERLTATRAVSPGGSRGESWRVGTPEGRRAVASRVASCGESCGELWRVVWRVVASRVASCGELWRVVWRVCGECAA